MPLTRLTRRRRRWSRVALDAGVEIVNDISGLRFDPTLADVAARYDAGLILMHSRGTFETMHKQEPVADILKEVSDDWRRGIEEAERRGVRREKIVLDPGIGFSKTQKQNVELIAKLDVLARDFADFPLLVGTSRKSFVGHLLGGAPVNKRVHGTMATRRGRRPARRSTSSASTTCAPRSRR